MPVAFGPGPSVPAGVRQAREHTFVSTGWPPKPRQGEKDAGATRKVAPAAAWGPQLALVMEASSALLPNPEEELHGEHGEVFTRRWVVELILDLVGYTADRDLARMVAVEPACGSGAFLVPMVERLISSCERHCRPLDRAADSIVAVDLLSRNIERSRAAVRSVLRASGVAPSVAGSLAAEWVRQDDFLLASPPPESADFVVGNPPYIRLEAVSPERSAAYRRMCPTMVGRADVYVGFYERGLLCLRERGALGYICADRWMRNAYGARLREFITEAFSVETLISLTGVAAFDEEVDAYPAITVLRRQPQTSGPLMVEAGGGFDERDASDVLSVASHARPASTVTKRFTAARLGSWRGGKGGWPSGTPERLALIADLEARYPALEDPATGTRVGIGVATGSDRVFIVRDPDVVEAERLLPLAMARDIGAGRVDWSGHRLVNPWNEHGLVELDEWPRTAAYLGDHREALQRRHTAKRGRWWRTIDRVVPGLTEREKLYVPDFKDAVFPVLDRGDTYPHHNLYWITSDAWDLRVLGGLLLSDLATLFVSAYSVRMRGGFLRFQAQYLRRIRLPDHESVNDAAAADLAVAFDARDREAATAIALDLYGLDRQSTLDVLKR